MPYAELDDTGKYIHITTTYADRYLIRQLPGAAWRPDDQVWRCRLSWAACLTLRGLFRDELHVGDLLASWARGEWAVRISPVQILHDKVAIDDECMAVDLIRDIIETLDKIEGEHELKLFRHQRVDVPYLILNMHGLLCNPMGVGKTASCIRAMQVLQMRGEDPFPALVICPNTVKETWAGEFRKFAPEINVSLVGGSAGQRRVALAPGADVYIINWESLRIHSRLAGYGSLALTDAEKEPKELNILGFKTVIADEAHRAKDPSSKQTRAMWAIMREAEYRFPVTGTPVASNVGDLWALLHAAEPEGFPAKTRYLERYARMELSFFGGHEILGLKPETADEFHAITGTLIRRIPKEAALPNLPPKLPVVTRHCEMTPQQARIYKAMEKTMAAQFQDEAGEDLILSAPNAIAKLTRLLQFASASASLEIVTRTLATGDTVEEQIVRLQAPSSKVSDLVDLLGEMGEEPLVVAAVSRQLIELAAARLDKEGISYGLVTGVVSTEDRQRAIEAFQDGRIRCILLTISTGGEGITLTRASTLLFMQRSWSSVQNEQVQDRLHRIGQTSPVLIIDQVTPGTIESRIGEVLGEKNVRIEEILQDQDALARILGV